MAITSLTPGQSYVGLLIDGVTGTPFTGATLRMEDKGPVVDVPFISHDETGQFSHVDAWFRTQTPPQNLILHTPDGVIGLYGITWRGHSVRSGVSLGQLSPSETVLGRYDAPLTEPLKIVETRSTVDGLREWTRLYGIESDREQGQDGSEDLVVRVRSGVPSSWQQGEATMTFVSDWRTAAPDVDPHSGLNISTQPVLVSKFPEPRPFIDHLVEQRKVLHLLTLIAGSPLHFRQHRAGDEQIVTRSMAGNILGHPKVELISDQTVRDYAQPFPSREVLNGFLTRFPDVGEAGMMRWSEQYEPWRRFILPAVGILGRNGAFMEDVILSTSMSIEAAGQLIGWREGEDATYYNNRRTTATNVYRCLDLLGVSWGAIGSSNNAIARGVANAYNDIKHFDRGEFPDAAVSHIVSGITKMIVRLLTLHILDDSGELLRQYREPGAMWKLENRAAHYRLTFNERGQAVTTESEGTNDDSE